MPNTEHFARGSDLKSDDILTHHLVNKGLEILLHNDKVFYLLQFLFKVHITYNETGSTWLSLSLGKSGFLVFVLGRIISRTSVSKRQ